MLAAAYPTVPEYQHLLATVHGNLGVLLRDLGQDDSAPRTRRVTCIRNWPPLSRRAQHQHPCQFASEPGNAAPRPRPTRPRHALEYETARDLQKKLVAAFPDAPLLPAGIGRHAHHTSGVLLDDLGQRDAARAEFETARDLQKKLVGAFPAVPAIPTGTWPRLITTWRCLLNRTWANAMQPS